MDDDIRSPEHRAIIQDIRKTKVKCPECSYTCDEKMLQSHIAKHDSVTCGKCHKTLQLISLKGHMENVHGKTRLECIVCHRVYGSRDGLQRHIRMSHRPYKHLCKYCDMVFYPKEGYRSLCKEHILAEHCTTCLICEERFEKNDFRKHIDSVHSKPGALVCYICQKTFVNKDRRDYHIGKWHDASRRIQCDFCDKVFTEGYKLREHCAHKHKDKISNKTFPCGECDKKFATAMSLKLHVQRHKDKGAYFCDQCAKSFCSPSNLSQHMKSLSHRRLLTEDGKTKEIRDYLCETCGVGFGTKNHLNQHYRSMGHIQMVKGDITVDLKLRKRSYNLGKQSRSKEKK